MMVAAAVRIGLKARIFDPFYCPLILSSGFDNAKCLQAMHAAIRVVHVEQMADGQVIFQCCKAMVLISIEAAKADEWPPDIRVIVDQVD